MAPQPATSPEHDPTAQGRSSRLPERPCGPSACRGLKSWSSGSAIVSTFADYFGLALMTPLLPYKLADLGFDETELPLWNGVISTAQFAAIVLGNLFWGRVSDRIGSQRSLLYAMVGDAVFFGLTAVAPFGLEGSGCEPSGSGEHGQGVQACGRTEGAIALAAVRAGAGFCTPLVSALVFIFDRADSTKTVAKQMGHYSSAVLAGYIVGGVLVGALYDSLGWAWLNVGSAGVAGAAAVYVAHLSAPAIRKGPKLQNSKGVRRALLSVDFVTHATTAILVGFCMTSMTFTYVIILAEIFLWDARSTGLANLFVVCNLLPINMFGLPVAVKHFAVHRIITMSGIAMCIMYALLAIWASTLSKSEGSEGKLGKQMPLFVGHSLLFVTIVFMQAVNLSRSNLIASKYAPEARGAITSAGRTCFAIGQALGPIVSGILFTQGAVLPYLAGLLLAVLNLSMFLLTGTPVCHDPSMEPVVATSVTAVSAPVPILPVRSSTCKADEKVSSGQPAETTPYIGSYDSLEISSL